MFKTHISNFFFQLVSAKGDNTDRLQLFPINTASFTIIAIGQRSVSYSKWV